MLAASAGNERTARSLFAGNFRPILKDYLGLVRRQASTSEIIDIEAIGGVWHRLEPYPVDPASAAVRDQKDSYRVLWSLS